VPGTATGNRTIVTTSTQTRCRCGCDGALQRPAFIAPPGIAGVAKAAIIVLAGNESHADHGRLANALEAAKEFAETDGDDVKLVFDGAGTQWVPELDDPESDYYELFEAVREHAAVCDFCASAFHVEAAVDASGLATLAEYDGHPSIRDLVADDYEVITF